jgi:hypothetical protein
MLEYWCDKTLRCLPAPELCLWTGSPHPHEYLLLLRTARLLQWCPTLLARSRVGNWLLDPDDRRPLLRELGLPPNTTMMVIRQYLQTHLDQAWPMSSLTYYYDARPCSLHEEPTARKLWQSLSQHAICVLVAVDPQTLDLHCWQRFSF